jgi:hypothetical protein
LAAHQISCSVVCKAEYECMYCFAERGFLPVPALKFLTQRDLLLEQGLHRVT